jgi:UPF0042 nucleotide-binding protein
MIAPDPTLRRIVFVTGPSGAGRSSALNVLEDASFEVMRATVIFQPIP